MKKQTVFAVIAGVVAGVGMFFLAHAQFGPLVLAGAAGVGAFIAARVVVPEVRSALDQVARR